MSVQMVAHKKLGSDVDIGELAGITKNFSGAELEGLVRWESCLVKSVRSKLTVMTMDDVVFLKEAGGKKSIPSFRAAQSCALNRLVKADSKVEYYQARARSAPARRACALRALGLLLADGTPTVGGGKTF